jgi:hypothetical protein
MTSPQLLIEHISCVHAQILRQKSKKDWFSNLRVTSRTVSWSIYLTQQNTATKVWLLHDTSNNCLQKHAMSHQVSQAVLLYWRVQEHHTLGDHYVRSSLTKRNITSECTHNLGLVTHKVPDHHLYHELQGLPAIIVHWPFQLLKMDVDKCTTSSSSCNDSDLYGRWKLKTKNLPYWV